MFAASKALPSIGRRYDPPALNGEEKIVYIKVINTNLGISTLWSLEKFEEKLAGMRDLYHFVVLTSHIAAAANRGAPWQYCLDGQRVNLDHFPPPTAIKPEKCSFHLYRGRNSLSRQTSGLLIGKVHTDTFVPSTVFSSVCKQLVTTEVESLSKDYHSQDVVLHLLTDLHEVLTSSHDVIQSNEALQKSNVSDQSCVKQKPAAAVLNG
ncbi:unnamed protein product [Ranitomeya imitator]|uniref:Uncharacterized protein n=1 Tax=Ranitomeya imitator TaxID=111125 RepID=A0ABN9LGD5_9NEOB|nr:unnamed protein product [Ranitomeya imitator]